MVEAVDSTLIFAVKFTASDEREARQVASYIGNERGRWKVEEEEEDEDDDEEEGEERGSSLIVTANPNE